MDYNLLNVTRSSYVFPDKPRIVPIFPIYIAPKIIRRYTGLRKTPIITSAVRYRNEQRKTYLWNPQFLDNTPNRPNTPNRQGWNRTNTKNRKTQPFSSRAESRQRNSQTASISFSNRKQKMSPTPQRSDFLDGLRASSLILLINFILFRRRQFELKLGY
jgi:hypothetical protein